MTENENKAKPRPPWEPVVRSMALVAGIVVVMWGVEAVMRHWDLPGVHVGIHVYEVRQGSRESIVVIAVLLASIAAAIWVSSRRKRP